MFKSNKKGDSSFGISFDLDRRHYYRVTPVIGQPVYLKMGGRRFPLINISAGGISFQGGQSKPGDRISAVLDLGNGAPGVPVHLKVVTADRGGTACTIAKIKPHDQERLHQYVLECQKQHLERQRALEAKILEQDEADDEPE